MIIINQVVLLSCKINRNLKRLRNMYKTICYFVACMHFCFSYTMYLIVKVNNFMLSFLECVRLHDILRI